MPRHCSTAKDIPHGADIGPRASSSFPSGLTGLKRFKAITLISLMTACLILITACGEDNGSQGIINPIINPGAGKELVMEGTISGLPGGETFTAPGYSAAAAGLFTVAIIDRDDPLLQREIAPVSLSGIKFRAAIPISASRKTPVIMIRETASGKSLLLALPGRVPAYNELPPAVRRVIIRGLTITFDSTALALLAIDKNLKPDIPLISISAEEEGLETVVRELSAFEKTDFDSALENNFGGAAVVKEFSKAVRTVTAILASNYIDGAVKGELMRILGGSPTAESMLKAFVDAVSSDDAGVINTISAAILARSIKISETVIDSRSTESAISELIKNTIDQAIDTTPPALEYASISPSLVKPGQSVNITVRFTRPLIRAPSVRICGRSAMVTGSGGAYTAAMQILENDPAEIAFSIDEIYGIYGNKGAAASRTTDGSASKINFAAISAPEFSKPAGTYDSAISVAIKSNIENAAVKYTLDGAEPSAAYGNFYDAPVAINKSSVLKAVVVKGFNVVSGVSTAAYFISPAAVKTETPVFEPGGGTYHSTVSVSLRTVTADATIRYTLDGTVPSQTNGLTYTWPFEISDSLKVLAAAYKDGMEISGLAVAVYTISSGQEKTAIPAALPPAGVYGSPQTVTLTSATAGAAVIYTLDGSEPSVSSGSIYAGPFVIDNSCVLKAMAMKPPMAASDILTAVYTIVPALPAVSAPLIIPASGTFENGIEVEMACATEGAVIYYTLDGTTPSENNGSIYGGAVLITVGTTIRAVAAKDGMSDSAVSEARIDITIPEPMQVSVPEFKPAPGIYTAAQLVEIACATPGAIIYYTLDGAVPTRDSLRYESPVKVSTTATVMAFAVKDGMKDSGVKTGVYPILPPVSAPAASPPGGTYPGTIEISITSGTPGARIYYTLDGTDPSGANGELYTAPVSILNPLKVKAVAVKEDMTDSNIIETEYIVPAEAAAPPVIKPDGGFFYYNVKVSITCATESAEIYFTRDGSDPSKLSEKYEAPFVIYKYGNTTIKAIAYKDGLFDSAVAASKNFLVAYLPPSPPLYESSATNSDGTKIFVSFNKNMREAGLAAADFTVDIDNGTPDAVLAISLNEDPRIVELTLTDPLVYGQLVKVAYIKGTAAASDGALLDSFELKEVENKTLSTDATLKASSTVKGRSVTSLGTPDAIPASAIAGSVTLTPAKAADTSNSGDFITLFEKNIEVASTKVVKYAKDSSIANFETDPEYGNERITDEDFFMIKVSAQDTSEVNYYKIITAVDIDDGQYTVTADAPVENGQIQYIPGPPDTIVIRAGDLNTVHYSGTKFNAIKALMSIAPNGMAAGDKLTLTGAEITAVELTHTAASARTAALGEAIKADAQLSVTGPAAGTLTVTAVTSGAISVKGGTVDVSNGSLTGAVNYNSAAAAKISTGTKTVTVGAAAAGNPVEITAAGGSVSIDAPGTAVTVNEITITPDAPAAFIVNGPNELSAEGSATGYTLDADTAAAKTFNFTGGAAQTGAIIARTSESVNGLTITAAAGASSGSISVRGGKIDAADEDLTGSITASAADSVIFSGSKNLTATGAFTFTIDGTGLVTVGNTGTAIVQGVTLVSAADTDTIHNTAGTEVTVRGGSVNIAGAAAASKLTVTGAAPSQIINNKAGLEIDISSFDAVPITAAAATTVKVDALPAGGTVIVTPAGGARTITFRIADGVTPSIVGQTAYDGTSFKTYAASAGTVGAAAAGSFTTVHDAQFTLTATAFNAIAAGNYIISAAATDDAGRIHNDGAGTISIGTGGARATHTAANTYNFAKFNAVIGTDGSTAANKLGTGDKITVAGGEITAVEASHTAAADRLLALGANINAFAALTLTGPAANTLTVTAATGGAIEIMGGKIDVSDAGLTGPINAASACVIAAGNNNVTASAADVEILSAGVVNAGTHALKVSNAAGTVTLAAAGTVTKTGAGALAINLAAGNVGNIGVTGAPAIAVTNASMNGARTVGNITLASGALTITAGSANLAVGQTIGATAGTVTIIGGASAIAIGNMATTGSLAITAGSAPVTAGNYTGTPTVAGGGTGLVTLGVITGNVSITGHATADLNVAHISAANVNITAGAAAVTVGSITGNALVGDAAGGGGAVNLGSISGTLSITSTNKAPVTVALGANAVTGATSVAGGTAAGSKVTLTGSGNSGAVTITRGHVDVSGWTGTGAINITAAAASSVTAAGRTIAAISGAQTIELAGAAAATVSGAVTALTISAPVAALTVAATVTTLNAASDIAALTISAAGRVPTLSISDAATVAALNVAAVNANAMTIAAAGTGTITTATISANFTTCTLTVNDAAPASAAIGTLNVPAQTTSFTTAGTGFITAMNTTGTIPTLTMGAAAGTLTIGGAITTLNANNNITEKLDINFRVSTLNIANLKTIALAEIGAVNANAMTISATGTGTITTATIDANFTTCTLTINDTITASAAIGTLNVPAQTTSFTTAGTGILTAMNTTGAIPTLTIGNAMSTLTIGGAVTTLNANFAITVKLDINSSVSTLNVATGRIIALMEIGAVNANAMTISAVSTAVITTVTIDADLTACTLTVNDSVPASAAIGNLNVSAQAASFTTAGTGTVTTLNLTGTVPTVTLGGKVTTFNANADITTKLDINVGPTTLNIADTRTITLAEISSVALNAMTIAAAGTGVITTATVDANFTTCTLTVNDAAPASAAIGTLNVPAQTTSFTTAGTGIITAVNITGTIPTLTMGAAAGTLTIGGAITTLNANNNITVKLDINVRVSILNIATAKTIALAEIGAVNANAMTISATSTGVITTATIDANFTTCTLTVNDSVPASAAIGTLNVPAQTTSFTTAGTGIITAMNTTGTIPAMTIGAITGTLTIGGAVTTLTVNANITTKLDINVRVTTLNVSDTRIITLAEIGAVNANAMTISATGAGVITTATIDANFTTCTLTVNDTVTASAAIGTLNIPAQTTSFTRAGTGTITSINTTGAIPTLTLSGLSGTVTVGGAITTLYANNSISTKLDINAGVSTLNIATTRTITLMQLSAVAANAMTITATGTAVITTATIDADLAACALTVNDTIPASAAIGTLNVPLQTTSFATAGTGTVTTMNITGTVPTVTLGGKVTTFNANADIATKLDINSGLSTLNIATGKTIALAEIGAVAANIMTISATGTAVINTATIDANFTTCTLTVNDTIPASAAIGTLNVPAQTTSFTTAGTGIITAMNTTGTIPTLTMGAASGTLTIGGAVTTLNANNNITSKLDINVRVTTLNVATGRTIALAEIGAINPSAMTISVVTTGVITTATIDADLTACTLTVNDSSTTTDAIGTLNIPAQTTSFATAGTGTITAINTTGAIPTLTLGALSRTVTIGGAVTTLNVNNAIPTKLDINSSVSTLNIATGRTIALMQLGAVAANTMTITAAGTSVITNVLVEVDFTACTLTINDSSTTTTAIGTLTIPAQTTSFTTNGTGNATTINITGAIPTLSIGGSTATLTVGGAINTLNANGAITTKLDINSSVSTLNIANARTIALMQLGAAAAGAMTISAAGTGVITTATVDANLGACTLTVDDTVPASAAIGTLNVPAQTTSFATAGTGTITAMNITGAVPSVTIGNTVTTLTINAAISSGLNVNVNLATLRNNSTVAALNIADTRTITTLANGYTAAGTISDINVAAGTATITTLSMNTAFANILAIPQDVAGTKLVISNLTVTAHLSSAVTLGASAPTTAAKLEIGNISLGAATGGKLVNGNAVSTSFTLAGNVSLGVKGILSGTSGTYNAASAAKLVLALKASSNRTVTVAAGTNIAAKFTKADGATTTTSISATAVGITSAKPLLYNTASATPATGASTFTVTY